MVAMVSSAQVFVGGSLGFESVKDKNAEHSTTAFNFSPEVGYVINDAWCVGLPVGIGFAKTAAEKAINAKGTTTWSVEPYGRWTFFKSGVLSLFVDGVLGFSGATGSLGYGEFQTGTNVAIFVAPGVALSITDNISLVSRLGSLGWNNQFGNGSYFGLAADASIGSVGVYYTF